MSCRESTFPSKTVKNASLTGPGDNRLRPMFWPESMIDRDHRQFERDAACGALSAAPASGLLLLGLLLRRP